VSAADVETLRRGYDAFRSGGVDAVLEYLDPDVEVTPIHQLPGSQTHRGHAGFRQYVEAMTEAFGELGWDAVDIVDLGDSHVLVETLFHGQGRGSGVPVEATAYMLWTFRDGKAVRVRGYLERADAIAAAGTAIA
jgi:ketosteroid isomerase-like protein